MRATLLFSLLAAAMLASPAPVHAGTLAIVGGTVETASPAGSIPNGTVLIRDGRIVAVGAGIDIPAGAEIVDARGKIVTPGFIDPESTIGLSEVSLEPFTVDTDVANDRFGAALDAADAFNPRSMLIPVNRIEGVTRAVVAPVGVAGGVIAGRSAAVNFGDTRMPWIAATSRSTPCSAKPARPRRAARARRPSRACARRWRMRAISARTGAPGSRRAAAITACITTTSRRSSRCCAASCRWWYAPSGPATSSR
jgi:hypothetical protein